MESLPDEFPEGVGSTVSKWPHEFPISLRTAHAFANG
jgi:hypothetical protein